MPSTNNTASKKIKQVQSEKRLAEEMAIPVPCSKHIKVAGMTILVIKLSEDDNLMNNTSALSDGMASSAIVDPSQPLKKLSVANDPVNGGDEWVDITSNNIAHNGPTAVTLSDKENKPPGTNDGTIVAVPTSGTAPVTEDPAITDNVTQSVLANGTPTTTLSNKENKPPGTDASAVGTQGSSQIVAPQVPFPFFKQLLAGIKAIPVLPHMKELGVSYGNPDPCVITPFILVDQFAGNKEKAKCLLNFAFNAKGHNMQNLFSALTQQYKYLVVNPKNDGRKIVYTEDNKDTTFFVIGKVTFCNLASSKYNKEIDIQPMGWQWPHCVMVLAQILKFNDSIIGVYKEGITFSTYRKPGDGQKEPTIKKIPVDGIHHGPSIRVWNLEVPMYSGQGAFALTSYPKLAHVEEFGVDSFILVAFTVGGYRTCDDSEHVLLNIQFVIGLEDQLPCDVGDVTNEILNEFGDETLIGVDDVTPMKLVSASFEPVDMTAIPGGPMM